ncbi:MAG: NAD(P)/FAD-dependent oxidoreductase [Candidatus Aenigmatarchaeota archaeon]
MKDLVVVGTGPAGYTAALYAKRYDLDVVVVGEELGGLCSEAYIVENWPGTKEIEGQELMNKMKEQIEDLGVDVIEKKVQEIKRNGNFKVSTKDETYEAVSVILALGADKRRLNILGEDELIGKGVSYCATCDAPLYRNKEVAVIGGADSGLKAAMQLAEHADKVTVFEATDEISAEKIMVQKCKDNEKIEMRTGLAPEKFVGDEFLKKIVFNNGEEVEVDGAFVEIGSVPNRSIKEVGEKEISRDEDGFIEVDEDLSTSVDGVFAAGDVTTGSNKLRQIVTASAEGAIAAYSTYSYVSKQKT